MPTRRFWTTTAWGLQKRQSPSPPEQWVIPWQSTPWKSGCRWNGSRSTARCHPERTSPVRTSKSPTWARTDRNGPSESGIPKGQASGLRGNTEPEISSVCTACGAWNPSGRRALSFWWRAKATLRPSGTWTSLPWAFPGQTCLRPCGQRIWRG